LAICSILRSYSAIRSFLEHAHVDLLSSQPLARSREILEASREYDSSSLLNSLMYNLGREE